jgi:hypothetical protein
LYVLEHAYKAVYRFPLAQDGLPAKEPDGALFLQGAVYPEGLAIDKVGHIFVADPIPNSWGCQGAPILCQPTGSVAEFAAGATGQQLPISTLHLINGPDRLNIDGEGRLYVHLNGNQSIAIFAKGAQGYDSPISVVPPYRNREFAIDYVIAKSGSLYILDQALSVAVYSDPLSSPTQPNRFMWPDGGYEAFFDQTIALDETTDRLYLEFAVINARYWNKVNYGVRPASGTSVATDPLIFTGDCGSAGQSMVGGTLIVKKYLIVSCGSNGDVLVYRANQFGRQSGPVETVGQGTLYSPMQMAVGP